MTRRVKAEDVNVPATAHEVPGGYPVHVFEARDWHLVAHVYAPAMPSPRPRVTSRGTFMPSDYRAHVERLSASLAYARGIIEAQRGPWPADARFTLDLAFWGATQTGDLDNLAKTIMDAGQLHRGEPSGAELWVNDRQITSLVADWIEAEDEWTQTVVRVRHRPAPERPQGRAKAKRGTSGGSKAPKARQGGKEAQE
jgi:Holliday junction resolvase RusA-like endonuclease